MSAEAIRRAGHWVDRFVASLVALFVIGLVAFLLVRNEPINDPRLFFALRLVLSLSAGILGATIPGFIDIRWTGSGFAIKAGGALALFVLTWIYTPDVLTTQGGKTQTTIIAPGGVAAEKIEGSSITINGSAPREKPQN